GLAGWFWSSAFSVTAKARSDLATSSASLAARVCGLVRGLDFFLVEADIADELSARVGRGARIIGRTGIVRNAERGRGGIRRRRALDARGEIVRWGENSRRDRDSPDLRCRGRGCGHICGPWDRAERRTRC